MNEDRDELIDDLLKQLENEDWVIRYNAAKIMGNIDAEEAIFELLDKLKRDTSRDVRFKIAEALGKIDLKISIPNLINAMKNDGSMIVRYTAARALGRMGAKEALPDIRKRLNKEVNSESVFWFSIAIARLEEDEKGSGIANIKELKKKDLLTPKMEKMFDIVLNEIKEKKKAKKN